MFARATSAYLGSASEPTSRRSDAEGAVAGALSACAAYFFSILTRLLTPPESAQWISARMPTRLVTFA